MGGKDNIYSHRCQVQIDAKYYSEKWMLNCRRKAELKGGGFEVGSGPNITERKGEIGYNLNDEFWGQQVYAGIRGSW